MSGTYPALPKAIEVTVTSTSPSLASASNNLTVQTRSRNVQRWSFNLSYPIGFTWNDFAPIFSFLIKQKGRAEFFDYVLDDSVMPCNGEWDGTEQCDGVTAVGATTVPIKGAPANADMKAGDLVQFNGHTKVYMLTDDATADGSGDVSIIIQPPLHESVANNEAVASHRTGNGLTFKCALTNDAAAMTIPHCIKHGLNVEMAEVAQ